MGRICSWKGTNWNLLILHRFRRLLQNIGNDWWNIYHRHRWIKDMLCRCRTWRRTSSLDRNSLCWEMRINKANSKLGIRFCRKRDHPFISIFQYTLQLNNTLYSYSSSIEHWSSICHFINWMGKSNCRCSRNVNIDLIWCVWKLTNSLGWPLFSCDFRWNFYSKRSSNPNFKWNLSTNLHIKYNRNLVNACICLNQWSWKLNRNCKFSIWNSSQLKWIKLI